MRHYGKKSFIFIEPCLSSYFLVIKAKEKGHTTLVLSSYFEHKFLHEEVLNASTAFFQLDINNDIAVLDLIERISQKFHIDGVIPGAGCYVPLTARIATYINRPGLTSESALNICQKDLMHNILKAHGMVLPRYKRIGTKADLKLAFKEIKLPWIIKPLVHSDSLRTNKANTFNEAESQLEEIIFHEERFSLQGNSCFQKGALIEEYIEGEEFIINGLLKNNSIHVVHILEKLLPYDSCIGEKGYIVRAKTDLKLLTMFNAYLKEVISALKLNYGHFQAKIKLSKKGPILLDLAMHLKNDYMPKLLKYATGIDYYDNILRLLSGQSLLLDKMRNLNTGIVFLNDLSKLKSLQVNPYVKELAIYDQRDKLQANNLLKQPKLGHVILLHKDYNILAQQMGDII